MSFECPDCERDARGSHDPDCLFCGHCPHCGRAMTVEDEEVGEVCPRGCDVEELEKPR